MKSSFSILLLFIGLSLIGLALIPLLPVRLSPSRPLPQGTVSFVLPGYASRIVEMEATSKLEAMLSRMKGIEEITSTSGNGWGRITLRFDKHANLEAARFEVSSIIRQAWPYLPQGISYPTLSMNRSDENAGSPFLVFSINAPTVPTLIQQFTENIIKPQLAQIDGLNNIDVSGAMPMEWQLEYDYKQLETLGLTVQDIQTAISDYLKHDFFSAEETRIALIPENKDFRPEQISVKNIDGKIITLDQLVSVAYVEQEASSYYRINGLNSIYMAITADDQANQLDLARKIKNRLKELEALFPAGYEIHTNYDATEYIQKELDKIYFRTGLTLLILLAFVVLIYRSFNYSLLIFLSLLMNIAIAVILYYFGGLEMQLYSLAGITISLTLVIDNTIVMSDQIIRQRNKKAFPAILAATVTTIASLAIIFFMDEKIRLNLQDFAKVIIINLSVSLFVALFLAPALLEKLKIVSSDKTYNVIARTSLWDRIVITLKIYFGRFYAALCRFTWRWRVPVCILLIATFGLPVFVLPEKLSGESKWDQLYNRTFGSGIYKETLRPPVDKWLGGTLRLFVQKVVEGSYWTDRQETTIFMTATLPNGSTLAQMNHLVQRMENYISQFPKVRQFQTDIQNARRASIQIQFTKDGERGGFPYLLQSQLIGKALELGGGSWGVYGLGDVFNNDVREMSGNFRVILRGFNYDELWEYAEQFKAQLLEHKRIKEVAINSKFSQFKDDYQEFGFHLNNERLAQENIYPTELYSSLQQTFGREIRVGQLAGEYGSEQIVLHSRQSKEYDVWSLEHTPGNAGQDKNYKLLSLATLEKTQAPQNIIKEDQQYRLCLQYEYIGALEQGRQALSQNINEFKEKLPMGYSIENDEQSWSWDKDNGKQYLLLLLIFVIIYFMCSILFNSLKQPLAVIFVIPISFIGIFLTFYLFKLNFDQGGFASFILLCGISVNANIYILNQFNAIRKNRKISPLRAYIQAWNTKIYPIILTVLSTILGFIPFMIGENKEAFWFPLAAGTIGGLIISLIGTFLFLPLFMGVASHGESKNPKRINNSKTSVFI
ncbi:MAG: efflux RND transporter permease subunit [Dysgonamonadaceae bacterium]|jgi:multidrug efflux pump subunit AcrB|nr:efflux RND transporter permease subunit [Dysgonamonadaceae bacterium]